MKLYFLRHADAAKRDPEEYPDDSQRPLTRSGHKRMVKTARILSKLELHIDLILSSPYLRARETAEIVRKNLRLGKDQLVLNDQLAPLGDASQLILNIRSDYPVNNLLMVGHEPELSKLISLLRSGETSLAIELKKGGICCLSVDELAEGKCAALEWLLSPAEMDILG